MVKAEVLEKLQFGGDEGEKMSNLLLVRRALCLMGVQPPWEGVCIH